MALTPQQAAQRLLIISKAKDNFHGFVKALYPQFELADFQMELIKVLDALEKGELGTNRLLITMPPRHGKSWLASTLFPVYYLARKPNRTYSPRHIIKTWQKLLVDKLETTLKSLSSIKRSLISLCQRNRKQ